MNLNELLKGARCSCGRYHTCPIKYVFIERGAISRLGEIASEYKNIIVVADENTARAAGERVAASLGGKNVEYLTFPAEPLLIPNEQAIAALDERAVGKDLIIGVGSGVIQDLSKYVSHLRSIPYFIVATAPSMDGYASTGAAMITDGMKVTYPAGLPSAVIADIDVLKDAPLDMIKAGYGDVVGKYSALNDWKLSALINGEYFCDYVYELTFAALNKTVPLAESLMKRDAESIGTLTEALILVGIAMSFAGNSRPASGSEHHLSHFFEITGIVHKRKYLPHGIDVFYSTLVTQSIREKLLATPFPKKTAKRDEEKYLFEMHRLYGAVSDGCISLQKRLGTYGRDLHATYLEKEAKIKEVLREVPPRVAINELLGRIGLDFSEFEATYGKEVIADAVRYAKDLKDRYTVLWLYYDLFGTEEI